MVIEGSNDHNVKVTRMTGDYTYAAMIGWGCFVVSSFILASCGSDPEKVFHARSGPELGIDFRNTIVTSDTLNALSFEYIYNGSGVAVGDFNNDGLEDLFFGGNQVSSRLYLNKGGLQFSDVTEKAGVSTDRWVTGVSAIDINQDGLLDVFLAVAGSRGVEDMRDLLFINQGIDDGVPHFIESAHAFGIDDDGYGTMGGFFDYDKDGDPDLYLVTNALESFNRNNLRPKRVDGEAASTDRLYRNNGDGTFTNVSRESGILIEGYGLGVAFCDLNMDSWPDIYVSNDFMSNDLIWINQRDGTFINRAGDYLEHQTHNGMGIDIADFNNDERPDIMVVDMLPPGHKRMKMITAGQNYDHFHQAIQMGYQPQYMRNTLQLNRGMFGDSTVKFSEVAFLAGVSSTDWSWAPLFADFDNDGLKDLFIANGYRKDVTDLDFIFFGLKGASPFGTTERRQERFNTELEKLPPVKLSNYMFHNAGSLKFEDKTREWGLDVPSFSNGAAYADLDNDGDLDIVVNNIDQDVIIYENRIRQQKATSAKAFTVRNDDAASFNQKVYVYTPAGVQYFETTPYRGFQSTVSRDIHVGLGTFDRADSIRIVWSDRTEVTFRNIQADTILHFGKTQSHVQKVNRSVNSSPIRFEPIRRLQYVHEEKSSSDIKITRTLLHELSHGGPCVAVGDVNGDQLDDVFIGGEQGVQSKLFIQQDRGTFGEMALPLETTSETGAAQFFDSDSDGDVDLYIAYTCASATESANAHALLLNDGKGKFTRDERLPSINASSACVVNADYDNDGDQDLFIAANLEPGKYPQTPASLLLRNDDGRFVDVTAAVAAEVRNAGMISSSVWADVNGDKRPDLVMAGEWTPILIFINEEKGFVNRTREFGVDSTNGWWNCVRVADINGDGFPEILAGNTGTNSFFQPGRDTPVSMVAKDFDGNGSIDPLVTYFNPVERDRFLVHNRLVLIDQVPGFKRRFETFNDYASAPYSKAFRKDELQDAIEHNIYTLESMMLINKNGHSFRIEPLPSITQSSTINDFLVTDFNGDSYADLLAVGNRYTQETLFGQYDASLATVLLGDGKGGWDIVDNSAANLMIDGDVRHVRILRCSDKNIILVVRNNGEIGTYVVGKK